MHILLNYYCIFIALAGTISIKCTLFRSFSHRDFKRTILHIDYKQSIIIFYTQMLRQELSKIRVCKKYCEILIPCKVIC